MKEVEDRITDCKDLMVDQGTTTKDKRNVFIVARKINEEAPSLSFEDLMPQAYRQKIYIQFRWV